MINGPIPHDRIDYTLENINLELISAYENFPAINSLSESFGIIYEEMIEYSDEVGKNKLGTAGIDYQQWSSIEKELIQIAAMAVRSLIDLQEKIK